MNRFVLLAVISVSVLAGCKAGEGESPEMSQKEVDQFRGYSGMNQAKQGGSGKVQPGPVAIAGETVVDTGQNRASNMPADRPAPASPGVPRLPQISEPMHRPPEAYTMKSDREVTGEYRDKSGLAISVEAVCKVTEDAIVCWKPDGKRDKNLESRLDQLLQSPMNSFSGGIAFKYKKKNRMILFKTTYPSNSNGGYPVGGYPMMSIRQIGSDMSYGYVNVSGLNDDRSGMMQRANYELRSVSVPFNQKTVDAYIGSTTPVQMNGTLYLKAGSKLTSGKDSIIYVSQKPGTDRMFGPQGKSWELTFNITRQDPQCHFSVYPILKKYGNGTVTVDQNGEIVEPTTSSSEAASRANRNQFFTQSVIAIPYRIDGKQMQVRINVNPKYVEGFRVNVMRTQTIRIKNIRLDY